MKYHKNLYDTEAAETANELKINGNKTKCMVIIINVKFSISLAVLLGFFFTILLPAYELSNIAINIY